MFVFIRAISYAAVLIGFLLIYVPGQILERYGIAQPPAIGAQQVAGVIIGTIGAALAVWCILTFATIGKGTPAPFDPPRKLVIRGPYRYVRNPMYIGAALALFGAGVYYGSWPILAYAGAFLVVFHLFVLLYEEPTLRRMFGEEYAGYCAHVRRWLPAFSTKPNIS